MLRDPNEESKIQLANMQREAKKTLRIKKRQWERHKIERIESNYRSNPKIFFGETNEIKIGFKQRTTIIKNYDGTLITNPNEVVDKFKSTFAELLNK